MAPFLAIFFLIEVLKSHKLAKQNAEECTRNTKHRFNQHHSEPPETHSRVVLIFCLFSRLAPFRVDGHFLATP